MPTRATKELSAQPRLLKAIARHHRVDLGPFGHLVCAGAYGEVAHGGRLEVGERLAVTPASASREVGLAASVARLAERLRA